MDRATKRNYDYVTGMQQIERSAAACFVANGLEAHSRDFLWNEGQPLVPVPEFTCLEIRVPGSPYFRLDFNRQAIEDSWERIDRPDVKRKLDELDARIRAMRGAKA